MSLATRCAACGTAFRVVQDQLKVSEGWVRCGRCGEVFSALEGLFDLSRDAPSAHAPAPATAAATAEPQPPLDDLPASRGEPSREPDRAVAGPGDEVPPTLPIAVAAPVPVLEPDSPLRPHEPAPPAAQRRHERPGPKPAVDLGARDRLEFSDARFDSDLFEESQELSEAQLGEIAATGNGVLPLESEMAPDFLRRVERRARWKQRPSGRAVAGIAGVAGLVLALQLVHHARDAIAAEWPSMREPLAAACEALGCRIAAPRRIDALTVENSSLTRAIGQDGYLLDVQLRSRSRVPLLMPSIDLALTDGAGRLVARRALAPADFRAAPTVAPNADVGLQIALDVRATRIAGYTVEIFYP